MASNATSSKYPHAAVCSTSNPRVPILTPRCSQTATFLNISRFWFPHNMFWYNQFSNVPQVHVLCGDHGEENSEVWKMSAAICRGISFLQIFAYIRSHVDGKTQNGKLFLLLLLLLLLLLFVCFLFVCFFLFCFVFVVLFFNQNCPGVGERRTNIWKKSEQYDQTYMLLRHRRMTNKFLFHKLCWHSQMELKSVVSKNRSRLHFPAWVPAKYLM